MENGNFEIIEKRVNRLESLSKKLAQSNEITNEVLGDLIESMSDEIRTQVKEEIVTRTIEIEGKVLGTFGSVIDEKVRSAVNERGLNRQEIYKLTNARNFRFRQLLGDSKGDKYLLYISFYQGAMMKGYRQLFNCNAYGDAEASKFEEAINYINNFNVTLDYYNWATEKLHSQYRDGEIENRKKLNAYERLFNIAA